MTKRLDDPGLQKITAGRLLMYITGEGETKVRAIVWVLKDPKPGDSKVKVRVGMITIAGDRTDIYCGDELNLEIEHLYLA